MRQSCWKWLLAAILGCGAVRAQETNDPVAVLEAYVRAMPGADISTLVAQLGAKSPTQRKAARRGLAMCGPDAVPELRRALTSSDPEVSTSARELIARLNDDAGNGESWLAARTRANQALRQLAATPDPKAWDALLRLLNRGSEAQQFLAAAALAPLARDRLPEFDDAVAETGMSEAATLAVLVCLAAARDFDRIVARHEHLAPLAGKATAQAVEQSAWQENWTTGRLDRDIFGKHTYEYTSPPLTPMSRPVIGVIYGLWGGRGEGDADNTPSLSVYVNDQHLGEIPADYRGYNQPGPSLTRLDLSGIGDRGRFKVRLVVNSGGHAKLGEIKIHDLTGKDPGVVTPRDKFHGLGFE